ncbi:MULTISPECIES: phosphonate ABC transporter, permease protein PhnE [unclassified Paraburkholderia]|uniref:phosphonate ABC transporter, permease protein PhnE n=1 Tax=unclassified Paraburkholderia TaxID=2615204 RepID=UPI00160A7649|nr:MULTISPECIES: phosphonate ABC transporter, permease protein PhnE [unclassified Paraburkholderia]MBB5444578.1 phosphonate transport system permease protein [Paraburkholderia sp. WSM4177]MBB5485402.1 phosphonate transport system permease protein [Paraburkholderia sp. WSM4180]
MNTADLITSPARASEAQAAQAKDRAGKRSWWSLLGWIAVLAVLGGAWHGADMRPLDLLSDSANMGQFAADFFPPDFTEWRNYVQEMYVTLAVAIWGTALSLVCAVPFGLMSANNLAPQWVVQPMRRLMDACRAINEMVFAMLFIVAVGLGPFAGVLALWVHTTGVLAKLFAEAVEAIDPRPAEGVRATGATRLDEIVYAVLPQVLPLWISYALYRFESNVRSAMVVGMVGAGGIGVVLYEAIRSFNYAQTAAVMIMVIVVVTVIDLGSAWLRERVI